MNKDTTNDAPASVAGKVPPLGEVIRIDEGVIKEHLDKVVVSTVEQTLNALLDGKRPTEDLIDGSYSYQWLPLVTNTTELTTRSSLRV
jgi:hypothetical protein